jgi:flagellar motor switch protein FliG
MRVNIPFKSFFNRCSPKLFITLFYYEYPQTIAYVLSFCNKVSYKKKVLKLLTNEWKIETDDIKNYLANCKNVFDTSITREMEIYCDKKIEAYFSGYSLESFRKNVKL